MDGDLNNCDSVNYQQYFLSTTNQELLVTHPSLIINSETNCNILGYLNDNEKKSAINKDDIMKTLSESKKDLQSENFDISKSIREKSNIRNLNQNSISSKTNRIPTLKIKTLFEDDQSISFKKSKNSVVFNKVKDEKTYNQEEMILNRKSDARDENKIYKKLEKHSFKPLFNKLTEKSNTVITATKDYMTDQTNIINFNNYIKPHDNFKNSSNVFTLNEEFENNQRLYYEKSKCKNYREKNKMITKKEDFDLNEITSVYILKEIDSTSSYGRAQKALRFIDVSISVVLIINILISIIDNELYIGYSDNYIKENKNLNKQITLKDLESIENRILEPIENYLRIFNAFICIFGVILIFFHYKEKVKIQQILGKLSQYDDICTSGILKFMITDMLVTIIFYPPYLNKVATGRMLGLIFAYNLNSIFSVVVFVKLYLILRVIKHFSIWTTEAAETICNNFKVASGYNFLIKAEMKKRPAKILFFLFVLSMSLLAFSMRLFEYGVVDPVKGDEGVKGSNDLHNLANCFWLIIVTMTTVGYGDFYPRSHLGRLIGVMACITGILLLSLMTVSLGSIFEFTFEEKKAFSKLKKLFAEDNLENKAVNVMKIVIKLRELVSRIKSSHGKPFYIENPLTERFILFTQLKKEISIFKNDYRISNSFSLPVDEMLKILEERLNDDITNLTKIFKKINGMDESLDTLVQDQEEVQQSLAEIISMQDDISKYMIKINNENYMNLINKDLNEEKLNLKIKSCKNLFEKRKGLCLNDSNFN